MAIEADPATIQRAAQDTLAAKEQAQTALRQLYDTVMANATQWQGASGLRFNQVMTGWNEQSSKLTNAMLGIADALQESGASIQATDEAQQAALGKFTGING